MPWVAKGTSSTHVEHNGTSDVEDVLHKRKITRKVQSSSDWDGSVYVEKKGLTINLAKWDLSDADAKNWAAWFEQEIHSISGFGQEIHIKGVCKDGSELVAANVDLSENQFTSAGVDAILKTFVSIKLPVLILRLQHNEIEDGSCLASFLASDKGRLRELHLSHNNLTTECATNIIKSAATVKTRGGAFCYPCTDESYATENSAAPLWLRLEHNFIDASQIEQVKVRGRKGAIVCTGKSCVPRSCKWGTWDSPVVHIKHITSQRVDPKVTSWSVAGKHHSTKKKEEDSCPEEDHVWGAHDWEVSVGKQGKDKKGSNKTGKAKSEAEKNWDAQDWEISGEQQGWKSDSLEDSWKAKPTKKLPGQSAVDATETSKKKGWDSWHEESWNTQSWDASEQTQSWETNSLKKIWKAAPEANTKGATPALSQPAALAKWGKDVEAEFQESRGVDKVSTKASKKAQGMDRSMGPLYSQAIGADPKCLTSKDKGRIRRKSEANPTEFAGKSEDENKGKGKGKSADRGADDAEAASSTEEASASNPWGSFKPMTAAPSGRHSRESEDSGGQIWKPSFRPRQARQSEDKVVSAKPLTVASVLEQVRKLEQDGLQHANSSWQAHTEHTNNKVGDNGSAPSPNNLPKPVLAPGVWDVRPKGNQGDDSSDGEEPIWNFVFQ